ncbi:shikimate dehydrogenase [Commensalibacter papalotli (ex Servin-Garciduenas et al. 2014)]|uniref:Shikimate dehydrogenase (NADP(+)) n=1 Tax=Commensalibacter papalotli (ex Servin-Garciduenas et al. 2014) TaxID=1208583 RepID=W7E6T3_9PROT|nr:shikimate dehydrogenase [Commensalibacter papalotli (ex Servin-Garciduenas et al. 2014)]EUK18846.1 shikimate 5-dehydrogenase [Commensalibacter papalotli (ex Servin-Garciduenas et al. 2014)]
MQLITGKAKIAAVLGWPIEHSRSPLLHNFWLQRYQIDGAYIPLAVKSEDFKSVIKGMMAAGFKGCNVTIPHKEAAYQCCDYVDETAKKMGSVNTLWFTQDGKIHGTSTDGAGFVASLNDSGVNVSGKKILVLGAGGAARSVAYCLQRDSAQVTITNRTLKRAEQLVQDLGEGDILEWQSWNQELGKFDVLVNTTSLGMEGKEDFQFDLKNASPDLIVTDIVYVPRVTPLLAAAQLKGLKTVEGLGMLLHQARLGFTQWFGVDPKVDSELTEFVANSLKK